MANDAYAHYNGNGLNDTHTTKTNPNNKFALLSSNKDQFVVLKMVSYFMCDANVLVCVRSTAVIDASFPLFISQFTLKFARCMSADKQHDFFFLFIII